MFLDFYTLLLVLVDIEDDFACLQYIDCFTSSYSFAEMAHGYVGADLAAVCKEAGIMSFKRCLAQQKVPSSLDYGAEEERLKEHLLVTREDIMAAFRQVRPSAMREVAIDVPKVGLFQSSKFIFVSKLFCLIDCILSFSCTYEISEC